MADVERQLAALATMSSVQLREQWHTLTASPAPRISPKMLRLALGWELQARAFGGLSRTTQHKLDQLGKGMTKTTVTQPGMRLVREWNGEVHVVTIGEDKVLRWEDREGAVSLMRTRLSTMESVL